MWMFQDSSTYSLEGSAYFPSYYHGKEGLLMTYFLLNYLDRPNLRMDVVQRTRMANIVL